MVMVIMRDETSSRGRDLSKNTGPDETYIIYHSCNKISQWRLGIIQNAKR